MSQIVLEVPGESLLALKMDSDPPGPPSRP